VNSDNIFAAIEEIALTPSKREKQELLRQVIRLEPYQRVLKAALDPFVTYGIAKLPDVEPTGDAEQFNEETWALLIRLATRGLTGAAAKREVADELAVLSADSAELLRRILTKDLRAGFSADTVNKVLPGLIPTFECMLAHPFEAHRVRKWPVFVEPKLDGVRVLAFTDLDAKTVRFFSRSGREFTVFDHLKEPLLDVAVKFPSGRMVFDGEVISGSFNKTVSEVRRKNEQAADAAFAVFDALWYEEFDCADSRGFTNAPPLEVRRQALVESGLYCPSAPLLGTTPHRVVAVPVYQAGSENEIHELYDIFRSLNLEGVIVKDPDARYRRARDYAWMKIKAEESVDVKIIDAVVGAGKFADTLGALVVDVNGKAVSVGSGLSDAQRDEMWKAHAAGELAGRLCEVQYHEITPDGSLRHPRFVRFRDSLTGAQE